MLGFLLIPSTNASHSCIISSAPFKKFFTEEGLLNPFWKTVLSLNHSGPFLKFEFDINNYGNINFNETIKFLRW